MFSDEYIMANNIIKILKVGRMGYSQALKLQNTLAALHQENTFEKNDTLVFVEHDPVYTIGIRTKDYSEKDKERLQNTGAEFFKTNRGGLITFHGPGQLVVYPILNLKNFKTSMRWYVCHIEKTVIDVCRKLELKAETSPHTGVWIGDNKVCAVGVHGSRFITTHGLALNCNIDLSWYKHIVPCGIADKGVTSLSKELDRDVCIDNVMPLFIDSFCDVFNCSYESFPEDKMQMLSNA